MNVDILRTRAICTMAHRWRLPISVIPTRCREVLMISHHRMMFRCLPLRGWLAGLCVLLFLSPKPAAAQDETFQKLVAPFLTQHCVSCHGPKKQESRLRLDEVAGMEAGNRNLWTLVHERISAGEMPPKSRPQPAEADKKK